MKCYRCGSWPCTCKDGIFIIHGDCREVLPQLPAVDAVLTDPPYGIAGIWRGGGGGASSWRIPATETHRWDTSTVDAVLHLPKLGECIIWGGNYYSLPPSRCWLIWDKRQPDTWTTGQAELCWTNLDRPVRVFRMSQAEAYGRMGKQHPSQKPIELILWCMKWICKGCVFDPFAGSGTTLVAAKQLGRRCIGIEIEERYCEIAANRLRQEVLQFTD